jgi:hypothetical protein
MNIEYDNELNNRMNTRHLPSQQLRPLYEVRPVATKYSFFQTVDERVHSSVPILDYPTYSNEVFNPGSRAPVDFYMKEIDTEMKLRNQFMALQKGNQSAYIPALNSSLYNFPMADKIDKYSKTDCSSKLAPVNLAPNTFNNTTRMNLRI